MGRDRYAEYAAQRLAGSAVDRLLEGHLQPGSTASGTEQRDALLDSQWAHVLGRLDLPVPTADPRQFAATLGQWFTERAFPRGEVDLAVRSVVDADLVPYVPAADGLQATQWLPAVRAQLAARRAAVAAGADQVAYRWAYSWHQGLLDRTADVVTDAVAWFGLPYAAGLVARLRRHVEESVAPGLRSLAVHAPTDVTALPAEVEASVGSGRGVIVSGQAVVTRVVEAVRGHVRTQVYSRAADLADQSLGSFVPDVLAALDRSLGEAQLLLEQARTQGAADVGLARLATDHYPAWPSDRDAQVPSRFGHADNEVLLTSADVFSSRYEADVTVVGAQGAPGARFPEARAEVVTQVVSGVWPTTGGRRPPGGLLEQTSPWRSRVFGTEPTTGTPLVPAPARFDLHVRVGELLDRARQLVARPEESFSRFVGVSLRDYVTGEDAAESERPGRVREVAAKFREALSLALPLVAADADAVRALHSPRSLEYRYKFSAVPFAQLGIAADLRSLLGTMGQIDPSSVANLESALRSADTDLTKIDIFGSYPNYSPLVFEGVLRPIAEQWAQTPAKGRDDFWRWRRSRPLPAALPMADVERRAMTAGWFLAQITGDLRIPDPPFTSPVSIWDAGESRWVDFPHPLLTPPTAFLASFDWLPAVLESVLLAYLRSHDAPAMSSLRPYQVLRGSYDSSDYAPAMGEMTRFLSGTQRLGTWLQSGTSPAGGTSRVPGAASATTANERVDAARAWLRVPYDLASVDFMDPGQDGAPGGGRFSALKSRQQAALSPIFRDLAPDVRWACARLDTLLDEALQTGVTDPVF
ncbi:MAG TPA: hypothetical protein VGC57_09895 [Cellulomonas sp.]